MADESSKKTAFDKSLVGVKVIDSNPAVDLAATVLEVDLATPLLKLAAAKRQEYFDGNLGPKTNAAFLHWATLPVNGWRSLDPKTQAQVRSASSILVRSLKNIRKGAEDLDFHTDLPEVMAKAGSRLGKEEVEVGEKTEGICSLHVLQNHPELAHGKVDFHLLARGTAASKHLGDWPVGKLPAKGEFQFEKNMQSCTIVANLEGEWNVSLGERLAPRLARDQLGDIGSFGMHVRHISDVVDSAGFCSKKDGELAWVRPVTGKKRTKLVASFRDGTERLVNVSGPCSSLLSADMMVEFGPDWACILGVNHFLFPNLWGTDMVAHLQERIRFTGYAQIRDGVLDREGVWESPGCLVDGLVFHTVSHQVLAKFVPTVDMRVEDAKKRYQDRLYDPRHLLKEARGIWEFHLSAGKLIPHRHRKDKNRPNGKDNIKSLMKSPDAIACLGAFYGGLHMTAALERLGECLFREQDPILPLLEEGLNITEAAELVRKATPVLLEALKLGDVFTCRW